MSRWHGESNMRGKGGGWGVEESFTKWTTIVFFISTELRRQYFLNFQGSHELIPPAFRFPNLEPGGGTHLLAGEGAGGSQFGRLKRKPGTLSREFLNL